MYIYIFYKKIKFKMKNFKKNIQKFHNFKMGFKKCKKRKNAFMRREYFEKKIKSMQGFSLGKKKQPKFS